MSGFGATGGRGSTTVSGTGYYPWAAWLRPAWCRSAADRSGGTPPSARASREQIDNSLRDVGTPPSAGGSHQACAGSGRAESGSPGVGLGTLENSSFAHFLPSIIPRNVGAVRFPAVLDGGSSARRWSYAPISCPLGWAMIRTRSCSPVFPLGGSRSIPRGNRPDQGCPGARILGILPVTAWWEDSRGEAGFADGIEHGVGRPGFSYNNLIEEVQMTLRPVKPPGRGPH